MKSWSTRFGGVRISDTGDVLTYDLMVSHVHLTVAPKSDQPSDSDSGWSPDSDANDGALIKLENGEVILAVYGKKTGHLVIAAPKSHPIRTAIKAIVSEIPPFVENVLWTAESSYRKGDGKVISTELGATGRGEERGRSISSLFVHQSGTADGLESGAGSETLAVPGLTAD